MCRVLGIKNYSKNIHLPLVGEFLRLAVCGRVPENSKPGHTDGWGFAGYDAAGAPSVVKSGGSAIDERNRILDEIKKIDASPVLIVHLRKSAWDDTTYARHAHPFTFDKYIFAHNGTVEDYKNLAGEIPSDIRPADDSCDTEVLFRYLAGRVMSGHLPSVYNNLRAAFADVAVNRAHTSLTSLFSDGKDIYAFREYTKRPDYYTIHAASVGYSAVVSSEPLPGIKTNWRPMEAGELLRL
ncbi:MAG: class II glutamine amidotransferase [Elusimicrobia bacterium HGW-Elusimicrobia-1]|jgi:glutamine amidotransferase|nr:MAG: class II glutamine amidotransferase [Elusimicrobia bacterium HGW-Elusimicrobia-1]